MPQLPTLNPVHLWSKLMETPLSSLQILGFGTTSTLPAGADEPMSKTLDVRVKVADKIYTLSVLPEHLNLVQE